MAYEATGGATDLSIKYQKLATEYAKMRAQVIVLKKGVLEEQERNTVLTEQAHEKDTQLRKYESEMEGVLFRNQQLSRRVNILQEEIDAHQTKSKSRWKSTNGATGDRERADTSVINEELVAKITENARLHSTLDNIEKQYETTILTLQARIQDLEREKAALGNEKKNREREVVESVSELHQEKEALRNRVSLLERDLALKTKQVETLEVQVDVLRERLHQLETVSKVDFSAVYTYRDPEEEKRNEEQQRELASLSFRLEESLTKLREVERDREHWRLELQLIQIKLEKHRAEAAVQDDRLEVDIEEIMTSREEEIKAAFEERLGEVVRERLMADSKSTTFFLECEALAHKVLHLESEMGRGQSELLSAKARQEKVEEESRTLVANYEEQLSVMSDLLADMNGRLAAQGDTIHQLRQELEQNDGRKKGKK